MVSFYPLTTQRTPLEELSLTIVALELGNPAEFLKKAIQPPPPEGSRVWVGVMCV